MLFVWFKAGWSYTPGYAGFWYSPGLHLILHIEPFISWGVLLGWSKSLHTLLVSQTRIEYIEHVYGVVIYDAVQTVNGGLAFGVPSISTSHSAPLEDLHMQTDTGEWLRLK